MDTWVMFCGITIFFYGVVNALKVSVVSIGRVILIAAGNKLEDSNLNYFGAMVAMSVGACAFAYSRVM